MINITMKPRATKLLQKIQENVWKLIQQIGRADSKSIIVKFKSDAFYFKTLLNFEDTLNEKISHGYREVILNQVSEKKKGLD